MKNEDVRSMNRYGEDLSVSKYHCFLLYTSASYDQLILYENFLFKLMVFRKYIGSS